MVFGHCAAVGIAIFVHRRIIHHSKSIHTTSIIIYIKTNHSELRLVAAYKKPQNLLHLFEIDALLDTQGLTVIAGDLNSKNQSWFSQHPNPVGKALAQYAEIRADIVIIASNLLPKHPRKFTWYFWYSHYEGRALSVLVGKPSNRAFFWPFPGNSDSFLPYFSIIPAQTASIHWLDFLRIPYERSLTQYLQWFFYY